MNWARSLVCGLFAAVFERRNREKSYVLVTVSSSVGERKMDEEQMRTAALPCVLKTPGKVLGAIFGGQGFRGW